MTQIVTSYNSGAPLSEYYTHQFVQNETTCTHPGGVNVAAVYPPLEHTPVVAGTLTGTVYVGHTAIQVFVVSSDGVFTFTDIGHSIPIKCQREGSSINLDVGEITLQWTGGDPGPNHFVVSYEYNIQAEYDRYSLAKMCGAKEPRSKLPNPSFSSFFTSQKLYKLYLEAATKVVWDWSTALGDTVTEKFESLYVKFTESTNCLLQKGAKGYFWVAVSPKMVSVLEASSSFERHFILHELEGQEPLGLGDEPTFRGVLCKKWRVYSCPGFDCGRILIGCNDEEEHQSHYLAMTVENFDV
jgi:hypothetical protein